MKFVLALIYFTAMLQPGPVYAQSAGDRLDRAFKRLDTNRNGTLSHEEVTRFAPVAERLAVADADADGVISFDEFKGAIIRANTGNQNQREAGDEGRVQREDEDRLEPGKTITRSIEVGNLRRRYVAYLPTGYRADVPTALVIAFHGGGGNPQSMMRLSGLNEKADEAGFVVVYPYGTGRNPDTGLTFNGGDCCGYAHRRNIDDVAFVRALLDDLDTVVTIDANRVYATGLSNGGMMAYRLAAELSDRIAAIAPVGGPMMTDTCNPERPVAVLHFHGTADRLAPFDGGRGDGAERTPAALRPTFNSVAHGIDNWVRANGCDPTPTVEILPDTADDGMRSTRKTWSGGNDGTEVVLIEIENGGHTWPGEEPVADFLGESTKDFSANDLMWAFFQKHARGQEQGAATDAMELLRTPEANFEGLPNYDFEPHYVYVDDPNLLPGNQRIRVHYTYSGPDNAPTLVMLHGNPSWSFLFRNVVPSINAAGYRTLMIDYVGHGKSDKPARVADYSYDRHVNWMQQVLTQLDEDPELRLDRAVLFGHDYGHPIGARLMAEHFPERFDGFINCNAGLNRGTRGIASRHQRWRTFVRNVDLVPVGSVICRNRGRAELGLPECPDDVVAGYDAPYPSGDYQASIRAFPEMVPENEDRHEARANQRAWEFLTRFQRPYMVIWENWDMPDARNRRAEYIAAIPGAFGHEQPQFITSHYAPEDEPEAVAAAVIQFLDDIYRTPAFRTLYRSSFSHRADGFVAAGDGPVYDAANRAVAVPAALDAGAVVTLQHPLDISGATEIKIAFRFVSEGLATSDQLMVEIGDGTEWAQVLALKRGADRGQGDFTNGSTDYGYVRLPRAEIPFTEAVYLRFRCRGVQGDVYIKELGVYASGQ